MDTKHTPGPWHVGENKASRVVYAADGYAIADAKVYHGAHSGTEHANAALMAAAPDMLAALHRIEHLLSRQLESNEANQGHDETALADARATIAKAEGR